MEGILEDVAEALIVGNEAEVKKLTQEALDKGVNAKDILDNGLLPKMEATIEALKEAGIRDQVKIMAGGAPVTQDFIEKIGAATYGANAAAASEKAKALVA
jgi:methanogenic corrinoid protein MtbC1